MTGLLVSSSRRVILGAGRMGTRRAPKHLRARLGDPRRRQEGDERETKDRCLTTGDDDDAINRLLDG